MEIELNQGKILKFSPEDAHLLAFKWTAVNNPAKGSLKDCWYAQRRPTINGRRVTIYFHREVMKPGPGLEVDHLNGDGLDCQRENMENVTHRENVIRAKARQWA